MSDNDNKYDQPISGHSYDGIEELDNPLPRWWLAIFWISVIYGIGYYAYYEHMGGPSMEQELSARLEIIQEKKDVAEAKKPDPSTQDFSAILADASKLEKGGVHYQAKCAACHGNAGQGLIGPNLTDKYWMHGKGKMGDLVGLIEKGIPAKGMPPWKGLIPDEEIVFLAAYIKKMEGSNPAGAKAPQGELIEE